MAAEAAHAGATAVDRSYLPSAASDEGGQNPAAYSSFPGYCSEAEAGPYAEGMTARFEEAHFLDGVDGPVVAGIGAEEYALVHLVQEGSAQVMASGTDHWRGSPCLGSTGPGYLDRLGGSRLKRIGTAVGLCDPPAAGWAAGSLDKAAGLPA